MTHESKTALNNETAQDIQLVNHSVTEETLATIWKEVLQLQKLSVEEGFLALGGQSLMATSVVNRMRQQLGIEVPVRMLLEETTTIKSLSKEIDEFVQKEGNSVLSE